MTWNFDATLSGATGFKFYGKTKVKCTLVQALRLCTGHMAHRESRGIALLFLDHGTRRGWGVNVTSWPFFTSGKDLVPIVQEAGWVPGPVWTGAENLAPTGIRSPDRQDHSQSLYRLRYPARDKVLGNTKMWSLLNYQHGKVCTILARRTSPTWKVETRY